MNCIWNTQLPLLLMCYIDVIVIVYTWKKEVILKTVVGSFKWNDVGKSSQLDMRFRMQWSLYRDCAFGISCGFFVWFGVFWSFCFGLFGFWFLFLFFKAVPFTLKLTDSCIRWCWFCLKGCWTDCPRHLPCPREPSAITELIWDIFGRRVFFSAPVSPRNVSVKYL